MSERESLIAFRFPTGLTAGFLIGAVASNLSGPAGWVTVAALAGTLALQTLAALLTVFKVVRRG